MKTHFDIEAIVKNGIISNELDYDRALIADRKLRILAREDNHFKNLRSNLRDLIEQYEKLHWSNVEQINDEKLVVSDKSEETAESERVFLENRKQAIKKKLREFDLTQVNLASLLGHKSKTHMSELINGIKPFALKDLIIINRLLEIEISVLLPVFLTQEESNRVKQAVLKLDKQKLQKMNIDYFRQSEKK